MRPVGAANSAFPVQLFRHSVQSSYTNRRKKGEGRRKKKEGRREKGEGRREKEEGRRKKGEGRREKEEGRKEGIKEGIKDFNLSRLVKVFLTN